MIRIIIKFWWRFLCPTQTDSLSINDVLVFGIDTLDFFIDRIGRVSTILRGILKYLKNVVYSELHVGPNRFLSRSNVPNSFIKPIYCILELLLVLTHNFLMVPGLFIRSVCAA
ncbi:hypothetical protein EB73_16295 [Mycobacterium sp. SWH-M3]|nr:hypothetical protein EB73_16295 [Mycobacterium sp. SWH-M3]